MTEATSAAVSTPSSAMNTMRAAWRPGGGGRRRQRRAAAGELEQHRPARLLRPSRTAPWRGPAAAPAGRSLLAGAAARPGGRTSSSASRTGRQPGRGGPGRAAGTVRVGREQQRRRHRALHRVHDDGRRLDRRHAARIAAARPRPPGRPCSAPPRPRPAAARAAARRPAPPGRAASTTHSTVSSGASRQITGSIRLRTMSAGSATPLVSITMPSGRGDGAAGWPACAAGRPPASSRCSHWPG